MESRNMVKFKQKAESQVVIIITAGAMPFPYDFVTMYLCETPSLVIHMLQKFYTRLVHHNINVASMNSWPSSSTSSPPTLTFNFSFGVY